MTFKGLSAETLGKVLEIEKEKWIAQGAEKMKEELEAERTAGAREVLTYLHFACTSWETDSDGEYIDGVAHGHTQHTVSFEDGVLEELMGLAGLKPWGEHAIDLLRRAAAKDYPEEVAEPPEQGPEFWRKAKLVKP